MLLGEGSLWGKTADFVALAVWKCGMLAWCSGSKRSVWQAIA